MQGTELTTRAEARRVSDGDRSAEIADAIMDACAGLGSAPGTRLPTERSLSVQLGVSRTTIRHGLATLEAQGRISRQVGRGTYLRETTALSAYVNPGEEDADTVGPVGLMAVRQAIEPCALPLVVTAATSKDFEEMDRCLLGGDTAQTRDEFEAWDFALHHAIVAATHNPLLVRMYRAVEAARHGQIWGNLKRRQDSTGNRRAYQEEHRAVVAALKAREPDLAMRAMTGHLDRVATILFGDDARPATDGVRPRDPSDP